MITNEETSKFLRSFFEDLRRNFHFFSSSLTEKMLFHVTLSVWISRFRDTFLHFWNFEVSRGSQDHFPLLVKNLVPKRRTLMVPILKSKSSEPETGWGPFPAASNNCWKLTYDTKTRTTKTRGLGCHFYRYHYPDLLRYKTFQPALSYCTIHGIILYRVPGTSTLRYQVHTIKLFIYLTLNQTWTKKYEFQMNIKF